MTCGLTCDGLAQCSVMGGSATTHPIRTHRSGCCHASARTVIAAIALGAAFGRSAEATCVPACSSDAAATEPRGRAGGDATCGNPPAVGTAWSRKVCRDSSWRGHTSPMTPLTLATSSPNP